MVMLRHTVILGVCLAAMAPAQVNRDAANADLSQRQTYGTPSMPEIRKVEFEVVSVDAERREMILRQKKENKDYGFNIDKSVKLSADKKVMRRKPELSDFAKGDLVKASMSVTDSRVLEIRLVAKGQPPS